MEKWGVDLNALKAKAIKRVFRAWVEDWEKESIKHNDVVAEVKLLEKYKGLAFWDPNDQTTYTIDSENMQWFRSSKKRVLMVGGTFWQRMMMMSRSRS